MKITKRQLRRIIKEERAKILRESFADAVNQGRAQSRAREEAEFGSFEDRVRDLHDNISSAAEETYTGFDDDDPKIFEELMKRAGISRQ